MKNKALYQLIKDTTGLQIEQKAFFTLVKTIEKQTTREIKKTAREINLINIHRKTQGLPEIRRINEEHMITAINNLKHLNDTSFIKPDNGGKQEEKNEDHIKNTVFPMEEYIQ